MYAILIQLLLFAPFYLTSGDNHKGRLRKSNPDDVIWFPVPGYEGAYSSSQGEVFISNLPPEWTQGRYKRDTYTWNNDRTAGDDAVKAFLHPHTGQSSFGKWIKPMHSQNTEDKRSRKRRQILGFGRFPRPTLPVKIGTGLDSITFPSETNSDLQDERPNRNWSGGRPARNFGSTINRPSQNLILPSSRPVSDWSLNLPGQNWNFNPISAPEQNWNGDRPNENWDFDINRPNQEWSGNRPDQNWETNLNRPVEEWNNNRPNQNWESNINIPNQEWNGNRPNQNLITSNPNQSWNQNRPDQNWNRPNQNTIPSNNQNSGQNRPNQNWESNINRPSNNQNTGQNRPNQNWESNINRPSQEWNGNRPNQNLITSNPNQSWNQNRPEQNWNRPNQNIIPSNNQNSGQNRPNQNRPNLGSRPTQNTVTSTSRPNQNWNNRPNQNSNQRPSQNSASTMQRPNQSWTSNSNGNSSTTAQDPTQTTTTTPSPELAACQRRCPVTPEYNPVCGSDARNYNNPGRLKCAQMCGTRVTLDHYGVCGSGLPQIFKPTPKPSSTTASTDEVSRIRRPRW